MMGRMGRLSQSVWFRLSVRKSASFLTLDLLSYELIISHVFTNEEEARNCVCVTQHKFYCIHVSNYRFWSIGKKEDGRQACHFWCWHLLTARSVHKEHTCYSGDLMRVFSIHVLTTDRIHIKFGIDNIFEGTSCLVEATFTEEVFCVFYNISSLYWKYNPQ